MNWISVNDRMPPINTEILAYAKEWDNSPEYEIIKCCYYDKYQMPRAKPDYKFHESCGCSGYECDPMNVNHVSHWMPLPEPPG